jgi:hypothetical protein
MHALCEILPFAITVNQYSRAGPQQVFIIAYDDDPVLEMQFYLDGEGAILGQEDFVRRSSIAVCPSLQPTLDALRLPEALGFDIAKQIRVVADELRVQYLLRKSDPECIVGHAASELMPHGW